jgi:hypothetical protein
MSVNQRLIVLDDEVFEATSALRHGLAILTEHRFGTLDGPAVMSLLALGVEKWCKLTLGLLAETDGGSWPPLRSMRAWKHDLLRLEREARTQLRARVPLAVAPGHVGAGLDQLDQDPTLTDILTALGRYASQGRFFNLDTLAEAPQAGESPQLIWDAARDGVATRLGLWPRLSTADAAEAKLDINRAMVSSVQGWWAWYRLCWVQGMCGSDARSLGRDLA